MGVCQSHVAAYGTIKCIRMRCIVPYIIACTPVPNSIGQVSCTSSTNSKTSACPEGYYVTKSGLCSGIYNPYSIW